MNYATTNRLAVLVIQHDPLLRVGIAMALRQHDAFEVFEGGPGELDSHEPRIDVVIADYGQAIALASPANRANRAPSATAKVLALTWNDKEADVRRAIEAGVHGYLLMGGEFRDLVEGVTAVASGMRYLCRSVAQRMADSLTRIALTSREVEVLRLVVTGEPNKVIARHLNIEIGTVKSHMSAIMSKLGATSRTHAAGIAVNRGLVDSPLGAFGESARSNLAPADSRVQYA